MKHVPRQRGLWTPPPGVSTAVFGDSFEDLIQKSEKVDMWTSVCLIILKATTVHQPRGGPGPKQTSCPLTSIAPLAHWGEPFHCPRQGVSYRTWGFGLHPKKKMREVEGRGSQGVKRKSEGQARGKSTAAGSSKRHFRLGGICGRPHYERMQVMQRNLTTASVNYNCK